jgi:hypothetical protein
MDEFISLKDIAEELIIPLRTIQFYRETGDFPACYRFGKRHLRVKRADFENWKLEQVEIQKSNDHPPLLGRPNRLDPTK